MQKIPIIIIGAGPAGLTAALQLKRVGISTLLFEGSDIGGLLYNANLVENYPGFPRGVRGPKLVNLLKKQVEHIGVEIQQETVISLEYNGENFVVKTSESDYLADVAVIASGTKPRKFGKGLIMPTAKKRVFYETRNLLDVNGEQILIVGAGDAAFDYALNLARQNRVTILNRGTRIRALSLLQERARENEHIIYLENVEVKQVYVSDDAYLLVDVLHQNNVEEMKVSYILGALGRIPNLDFLAEEIILQEKKLSAEGILYFIGDVRNGVFRQTAIAAGDGLRAAMEIEVFLRRKNESHC